MSEKTLKSLTILLLFIALIALLIPGFYSRLMADDYCLNASAKNTTFLFSIRSNYTNWSGRFGYLAVTYLLSRLPANSLGYQTLAIVLLWLVLLTIVVRVWSKKINLHADWQSSLILALTLLITLFKVIPNIFQDLFWRDGVVNYTLPLLFFTASLLALAWSFEPHASRFSWALLWLSAFAASSFSESATIAILTLWSTILVILMFIRNSPFREYRKSVAFLMVGSLCGFLVEFLAPGNAIRASMLPDRPELINLVGETTRNVIFLYGKFLILGLPWVLISFFIGITFGYLSAEKSLIIAKTSSQNKLINVALLLLIANVMVGTGVCAAVAYLIRAYPDDRIIIVPYFFAMGSVIIGGFLAGNSLRLAEQQEIGKSYRQPMRMAIFITMFIALVIMIAFIFNLTQRLPGLRDYALRWDSRDSLIKQEIINGNLDLSIPGLESRYDLADLQLESDDWINQCTAASYGAGSITGR